MNRERFIRDLRKYARKNGLAFEVKKDTGKGSHYRVLVGDRSTTVQSDFDEFTAARCLKQLGITPPLK